MDMFGWFTGLPNEACCKQKLNIMAESRYVYALFALRGLLQRNRNATFCKGH